MQNQNSDFEHVMVSMLENSDNALQAGNNGARNRSGDAMRGRSERIANLGIFLGVSVLASVAIVTQWMPATVDPSQLWVHAVIAVSIAQLAIVSGVSFKASARSSNAKSARRPARFVKPGRRIEPQLSLQQPQSAAVLVPPKAEVTEVSTGLLSGKNYVLFSDGTCEIDTMFGRRRFEDLDAAREFVGG